MTWNDDHHFTHNTKWTWNLIDCFIEFRFDLIDWLIRFFCLFVVQMHRRLLVFWSSTDLTRTSNWTLNQTIRLSLVMTTNTILKLPLGNNFHSSLNFTTINHNSLNHHRKRQKYNNNNNTIIIIIIIIIIKEWVQSQVFFLTVMECWVQSMLILETLCLVGTLISSQWISKRPHFLLKYNLTSTSENTLTYSILHFEKWIFVCNFLGCFWKRSHLMVILTQFDIFETYSHISTQKHTHTHSISLTHTFTHSHSLTLFSVNRSLFDRVDSLLEVSISIAKWEENQSILKTCLLLILVTPTSTTIVVDFENVDDWWILYDLRCNGHTRTRTSKLGKNSWGWSIGNIIERTIQFLVILIDILLER
jgi:hypothetical protein